MSINKLCKILGLFALVTLLGLTNAYAETAGTSGGGDVFDELALRAGNLGNNLQKVGYIIAGLGLIAFAVAAMFNKLSWKTFAYIAMSTFFLTAITAAISWVRAKPGEVAPLTGFSTSGASEMFSGAMDIFGSLTKNSPNPPSADSGH